MKCKNCSYVVLLILPLYLFIGMLSAEDVANTKFTNRILHVCSSGIRNNACDQTSKRASGNTAGRLLLSPDSGQVKPDYMSGVEGKIAAHFILPSGIYKDLSAVITFKISRDGNVSGKNLEKRSGNSSFDATALQAVDAAAPFGLPPRELTGVPIRVTFHP